MGSQTIRTKKGKGYRPCSSIYFMHHAVHILGSRPSLSMFFHQTEVITGLFLKLRSEGKYPSEAILACHRKRKRKKKKGKWLSDAIYIDI